MQKKVLIVEDEVLIAENLAELVEEFGYSVGPLARSYDEAKLLLASYTPDVIILDINLVGQKSGLELADEIDREFNLPYIFLTSYNDVETVNEIAQTNAAAYLSKPFNALEFKAALTIALKNKTSNTTETDFLLLNTGNEHIKVRKSDICFVKSDNVYLDIELVRDKRIVVRSTFSEIQEKLDCKFVRIHRSYLINLDKVDSIGKAVVRINKVELPVGKKYLPLLRDQLAQIGLK